MDSEFYKKFYDKLNTQFQLLAGLSILIFIPIWMYIESKSRAGETGIYPENIKLNLGLFSLILTLALVGLWHYQYHRALNKILISNDLLSRLNEYKRLFLTLIIKMTALSILICLTYFFIRADAMIASYAVLLVLISMNRLTYARIARQLKMNKEERNVFFGEG